MKLVEAITAMTAILFLVGCDQSDTVADNPVSTNIETTQATPPVDRTKAEKDNNGTITGAKAQLVAERNSLMGRYREARKAFNAVRGPWQEKAKALREARSRSDQSLVDRLTKEISALEPAYKASRDGWMELKRQVEDLDRRIADAG